MTRKIAIAIGVFALLLAMAWAVVPARASARGYTFESRPEVTIDRNRLRLIFKGRETGDLLEEVELALRGGTTHNPIALWAEVSLPNPLEPGTFPIDGKAEWSGMSWSFEQGKGNDPKITFALIRVANEVRAGAETEFQVSGSLTIERVNETGVAGRLELTTPDAVHMSSTFSARP